MALGHGRAQVQHVTIGGTARRQGDPLPAPRDPGLRRRSCEIGAILAPFMTRPMSSGVYDIAEHRGPHDVGRHEHHADRRLPRRRASGGDGGDRAGDGPVRRRDRQGPGRGPPDQPDPEVHGLVHDHRSARRTTSATTRRRSTRRSTRAGYAELRAEQARRRASGDDKQLGIGVSVYVEITGGVPPAGDNAKIEVHDDGSATVYTGTSPHGQGHDTAWSMITTERTGIPMDRITLVWGDTDLVPEGGGTMGSRSLQHGGSAVNQAATELVEKATAARRRRCSKPTRPTSCSTRTPARSTSPARRPCRRRGPSSPPRRRPTIR